ncbi:hypothetical protein F5B19DRAFT_196510 [Rostrohypoxylon terebratum]|nr:hypothetical protein F5B19DRAFT_196510 [Rostrohypoxylon terebratum]
MLIAASERLSNYSIHSKFNFISSIQKTCSRRLTLRYKDVLDVYARSFFPGNPPGERIITLHDLSFQPQYRDSIFNILCHEFGHTIGMRHWNAASEERVSPSVHFPPGSDNRPSIMGPYKHPRTLQFHVDDEKWLKEFYGKENGSFIQGYKIVDCYVDPRAMQCSLKGVEITRLRIV